MLYSVVRQLTGVNSNSNVPVKSKDGRMLLTEEKTKRYVEGTLQGGVKPTRTYNRAGYGQ